MAPRSAAHELVARSTSFSSKAHENEAFCPSFVDRQKLDLCCNLDEMAEVQNNVIEKWQFINRNLNDRKGYLDDY